MDETDAQAAPVWPQLEAVAQPARVRRRLSPEERSDIIVRLCALAPLSVKELSTLLDRSEAYVGDAIRPLVNEGRITFLFPDQPRHPKQKYMAPAPAPAAPPRPEPIAPRPAPSFEPSTPLPAPSAPLAAPDRPEEKKRDAKPETPAPSPYPNAWINLAVVLAMGILLATSQAKLWPVFGTVAALGLAASHIVMNSVQYDRYRTLKGRDANQVIFVLLKAAVALIEIAVVYFVVSLFVR